MFVFLYDLTMMKQSSLWHCSAKHKNLHLLLGVSAVL